MATREATYSHYRPGDLGRVVWLHGDYYHRHWGFDLSFEAQEARELTDFLLRLDPSRDLFLAARLGEDLVGAIAIDGGDGSGIARLRWFIVDERRHGLGLGRGLIRRALDFCRRVGHQKVFLWTFEGLSAARSLYDEEGFQVTEERLVEQWGGLVKEQRLDLPLSGQDTQQPCIRS
jgi:GNAT superfamily N-acetyltransferase